MNIVLTGGGTAGHVTPNIALINALQEQSAQLSYIGSAHGPEAEIISKVSIPFFAISCGKLRRYFSWQNFIDPFKTLAGIVQAWRHLRKIKPDLVFSKGGFVAFPVVVAAWLRRIPVIVHESDFTPGLANKLSFPFASKICLTFAAAKKHIRQQDKTMVTGTPIRPTLFLGDKAQGLSLCGFDGKLPVLMVMGGSLGSQTINEVLRACLPDLISAFSIIHICGRGNLDDSFDCINYCQFDYVDESLPHLFAAADMIVTRAGANALYEILALKIPNLLIPLPLKASRGDQIDNAKYFAKLGVSRVLFEEDLTKTSFTSAVHLLAQDRQTLKDKLQQINIQSATPELLMLFKEFSHDRQKSTKPIY
ncbi:undecaprenyldiphospho-muramoylpentapeptide beta-N-acetylglucosaminyltransferase [Legionella sp. W05-934-2]|uniref:undecaprenyldiphospho-muramoylpentapeptide beta-N-acetylglucosaminyltransferase n=1 Tax=Legionella sp. W05-934-2 TaxID=1198649 RepID=UPI003461D44F